jgi:YaiO family outer membrane protein
MVPCIRRYWTVAAIAGLLLAPASVSAQTILASTSAAQVQTPGSQIPPSVPAEAPSFGRFEISHYGNFVSNNLGQWYGGGLHLFLTPSPRVSLIGEAVYQRRPGEIEELGSFSATLGLTDWFYLNLGVSGGGPDDPAAFFPRIRYDVNGTIKTNVPGLLLTGGWTRLYYGNPVSGRIARGGFVQYAGKVVFQGNVNFSNSRPGNHKSISGTGVVQYGQEGHYWVGLIAGGGNETWQTQGVFPADVEFDGYNISPFARTWFTPSFGMAATYTYFIKRAAYHYNGVEVRFFWQF